MVGVGVGVGVGVAVAVVVGVVVGVGVGVAVGVAVAVAVAVAVGGKMNAWGINILNLSSVPPRPTPPQARGPSVSFLAGVCGYCGGPLGSGSKKKRYCTPQCNAKAALNRKNNLRWSREKEIGT